MRKNNTYTPEFKIKLVKEYLKGGMSYNDLKSKYNIPSATPIKGWVKQYQELGKSSFYEEKRGRKCGSTGRPPKELDLNSLTKDEQIEYLKKQLYYKQLENDVLKKVAALTQKN